ncbi:hypothetical protein [Bacteroides nordii]|nr:hypothetical protein [Bacteroides nordii]
MNFFYLFYVFLNFDFSSMAFVFHFSFINGLLGASRISFLRVVGYG